MKLFWICFFFVGVAAVSAQIDEEYYDNDYAMYNNENERKDDYQIEDNRSELQSEKDRETNDDNQEIKDELSESAKSDEQNSDDTLPGKFLHDSDADFDEWLRRIVEDGVVDEEKEDNSEEDIEDVAEPLPELDFVGKSGEQNLEKDQNAKKTGSEEIESKETVVAQLDDNVNDEEKIKDLSEDIANESEGNDFEDDKVDIENPVADEFVEETKQILEDTGDKFESNSNEEAHQNIEEDTNDIIDEELRAQLYELDPIYAKLSADYYKIKPDLKSNDINNDDGDDSQDYDASFVNDDDGRDVRNDEDNIFDSKEYDDETDFSAESPEKDIFEENEEVKLLKKIEKVITEKTEQSKSEEVEEAKSEEFEQPQSEEAEEAQSAEVETAQSEESEKMPSENVEEKQSVEVKEAETDKDTEMEQENSITVADLTPVQYDQLMEQFKVLHKEEMERSNDMDRNIAPVHVTLSVDEATVVESPNYPLPYPTNNVVDWVFTGDGVGIELNITDFFVNGVMGHYLLVIPGGIDDTNTDGLIFSYQLTEPRRYRFFDVDQMFVRFEAGLGMAFARGFSFSAKMIMERPGTEEEILPKPEAVIPEPTQTLTLHLGGLTLPEFRSVEERFRVIIADMATMYINANGIDAGLNDTQAITQIVRTAACNVAWPQYEHCAQVTFGVPLVYEEGEDREQRLTEADLSAMWYRYSGEDPFESQLWNMGVVEFAIPNDSGIMAAWVVIGVGVLISMALLAFALWRYSCLENYSRMPQYNDRDSLYSEKGGVDLYPTPHQTLPPLYAETADYKWDDVKFDDSARVDMGGFTNKSYARDMYDIDSDDDIITTQDRMPGFTKDKFTV